MLLVDSLRGWAAGLRHAQKARRHHRNRLAPLTALGSSSGGSRGAALAPRIGTIAATVLKKGFECDVVAYDVFPTLSLTHHSLHRGSETGKQSPRPTRRGKLQRLHLHLKPLKPTSWGVTDFTHTGIRKSVTLRRTVWEFPTSTWIRLRSIKSLGCFLR